jgi:hypothetical protein
VRHERSVVVLAGDLDELLNGPGHGDAWVEASTSLQAVLDSPPPPAPLRELRELREPAPEYG